MVVERTRHFEDQGWSRELGHTVQIRNESSTENIRISEVDETVNLQSMFKIMPIFFLDIN
jgi:hypothetical protein